MLEITPEIDSLRRKINELSEDAPLRDSIGLLTELQKLEPRLIDQAMIDPIIEKLSAETATLEDLTAVKSFIVKGLAEMVTMNQYQSLQNLSIAVCDAEEHLDDTDLNTSLNS